MKRPVMIAVLSLAHGELTAADASGNGLRVALFILLIFIIIWGIKEKRHFLLLLYIFFFMAGYLLMYNLENKHKEIESIADGTLVTIEGTVEEINLNDYNIELVTGTDIGKCIVLMENALYESVSPDYGNKIKITGKKCDFKTASNPGNYDERHYNYSVGNILKIEADYVEITDERKNEFKDFVSYIKEHMTNVLLEICPEKETGVFMAMLYGDKTLLDEELKEIYADGGISHILAISGLHISIMGMGVYILLRKCISVKWSGVISTIIMILYGIMAGGSVSAIRAIIMFFISLFAILTGYIYDMRNAICIAAFLLLLDNPYYLFNISFGLSFGAVIAIAFVLPYVIRFLQVKNNVLKSFLASVVINIVNGPMMANGYYEIAFYGMFLNLLVIPLMSIVVLSGIGGILIGSINIATGKAIISVGVMILRIYEKICIFASDLQYARIVTGHFDIHDMLIYYPIICVCIWGIWRYGRDGIKNKIEDRVKKVYRYVLVVFIITILHIYLYTTRPEQSVITFLDVGQGDSGIVVSESGNVCLFDGGSTSENSVGEYRILPYLKYRGIKQIDYIILSHSDKDHINGIGEILEDKAISVGNIVIPTGDDGFADIQSLAIDKGINVVIADDGMMIKAGEMEIDIINPVKEYEGQYKDVNDNSLVAIININGKTIGMMGDISSETEEKLISDKKVREVLSEIDVLKVAHHGSKYSTSEEFLTVTTPEVAVISCGEDNSYGHPHEETLKRLENIGSQVLIIPQSGTVTIKIGEETEVYGFRK